jgi:hypothetical protein
MNNLDIKQMKNIILTIATFIAFVFAFLFPFENRNKDNKYDEDNKYLVSW